MNSRQSMILVIMLVVVLGALLISYRPSRPGSVSGMEDVLTNQQQAGAPSGFDWQAMLFVSLPTIAVGLVLIDTMKTKKE